MKIKELQTQLQKHKIDCAVFFNLEEHTDPNFFYFVQHEVSGCLVVPQTGVPYIIASVMEAEKTCTAGFPVVVYKKEFMETLAVKIGKKKNTRVGIDESSVTLAFFSALKNGLKGSSGCSFADTSGICGTLRMIKTTQEEGHLRKACEASDEILETCIDQWNQFKTEREVYDFLVAETHKHGLVISFTPIVASGSGASQPHYQSKNIPLKKGFCVIDFGVKYQGYCSDTTRTIYLGEPTEKERKLYELVLSAQEKAVVQAKMGMGAKGIKTFGDLHNQCEKELGAYAKYFVHSLGHGVGVQIHEAPAVSKRSTIPLQNGVAFTIEPGVYLPGKLGIRIEDTLIMKNKKASLLTKISKKLIVKK